MVANESHSINVLLLLYGNIVPSDRGVTKCIIVVLLCTYNIIYHGNCISRRQTVRAALVCVIDCSIAAGEVVVAAHALYVLKNEVNSLRVFILNNYRTISRITN